MTTEHSAVTLVAFPTIVAHRNAKTINLEFIVCFIMTLYSPHVLLKETILRIYQNYYRYSRFIWIACKKMTEFRTKFYLFVRMKLLYCLYIILLTVVLVFHNFIAYFNTKTNVFLNLQPFPHYVLPDSQDQNLYTSVSSDCFCLTVYFVIDILK